MNWRLQSSLTNLSELKWIGVEIDEDLNNAQIKGNKGIISTESSKPKVWVIPTNEELLIARDTLRLIETGKPNSIDG